MAKMSKSDREEREESLASAVCMRLTAATEAESVYWSLQADILRSHLSATAARRAEKRGRDLASRKPPGFIPADEAIKLFDEICKTHKIGARDQDHLYNAVGVIMLYQLGAGFGSFHDIAARCGLVESRLGDVMRRELARARRPREEHN